MPRRIPYQLQWSPLKQEYIVFCDGKQTEPVITPTNQHWLDWLKTISSFSFQSRSGASCTVRKEAVQRGGTYWYAYRRRERQMVKRYLARTTDLTLERLETVITTLYDIHLTTNPEQEDPSFEQGSQGATISSQPLLMTRLHSPRLPVQYVSRPRLLTLLEEGRQGQLALIAAPAGTGKTTLLTEWAASTPVLVAWLSLETADNDPARFLAYLIAALASLDQRIDTSHQSTNAQNPEQALTGILNDLTHLLEREAVVILDDYHLLTTEAVHELLRFLLAHLPTRLHLMIGTRVDPPLPLARLRAKRQLNEIRTEALRFVTDEVETLTSAMGLALSNEATHLLTQRTEGWIAGIQLLTLALRGRTDASAFLQTFHGTHRFLIDYVSEEVLTQLAPDTQHFLLHTSILTRMTGPLCDAVTGLSGGQAQLAKLLQANLFVSALNDAETWYRYHALFADTLCARLQKREPELLPELYLRASRWYEQHQGKEGACDYALLAGDFLRAISLITELFPQMVEQGRFEQLGRWLKQLPPALIAASPHLSITIPWLYTANQSSAGHMEQAIQQMQLHVQQQNASTSWTETRSVMNMLQALIAMSQKNLPHAFSLMRKVLHTLTMHKTPLSQLISRFSQIFLSVFYGVSGDLASAEQTLLSLSQKPPEEPPSVIYMAARFLLGELYAARGQLRRVEAHYQSAILITESNHNLSPMLLLVTSYSLMRRATILYEWNHLQEAAHGIQQVQKLLPSAVLEVIPHPGQQATLAFGLWAQARIEWAQGHPEQARNYFEQIQKQAAFLQEPVVKAQSAINISVLSARLALLCGQVEEAIRWKKTWEIHFDDTPQTLQDGIQVFIYLTLARILIAQGRKNPTETSLSQALILLERWQSLAQQLNFQSWLIEIQMLTALALQAQGKIRQALSLLGTALEQAEVEHYVRLFADEGQPMALLLAHISAYTTALPGYIQRIQNAISATPQMQLIPTTHAEVNQPLLDPLSRREQEVLSLLAAGASNQQIADQLVISLNTAKRHVKHILAKLNVTNRLSAVACARKLHLL